MEDDTVDDAQQEAYKKVAEIIAKGAEVGGKKKKRNRRNKKKGQDSLTNELLNNLDTDDLVDFINNCGAKKEDIKRTGQAGPHCSAKKTGNNECFDCDRASAADSETHKSVSTTDPCPMTCQGAASSAKASESAGKAVSSSQEPISVPRGQHSKRKRMKQRAKALAEEQKRLGRDEAATASMAETIDSEQQEQPAEP